MIIRHIPLIALAALGVTGCQRTVASHLPTDDAAYTAIAVTPEIARPSTYTLRPGDRIDVNVFKEAEFSASKMLVDQSGNVTLPLIGTMRAEGMSADDFARAVESKLAATYLRSPRVSVLIDTPALASISVEGEVKQPGVYEVAPGSTLLTAMALARSPSDVAKLDEVMIFRTVNGERFGGRFDLAAIRAGRVPDPQILPGDSIVVGYSQARGMFQDFLKTTPLLNVLVRY
ncbi:polysaccharide biosynthesis/export family protein [Croceicoccus bisphenolivorans]|uniref:polysaccharide biosynthesis/export family protein n=1 Tax=Croceicoccus bisphenolivorans TaxID=1783232 RepID=UPI0008308F88|nr:polysaccharide biosynthesis/export family protein [Croceicoccus bisphenolivorans]